MDLGTVTKRVLGPGEQALLQKLIHLTSDELGLMSLQHQLNVIDDITPTANTIGYHPIKQVTYAEDDGSHTVPHLAPPQQHLHNLLPQPFRRSHCLGGILMLHIIAFFFCAPAHSQYSHDNHDSIAPLKSPNKPPPRPAPKPYPTNIQKSSLARSNKPPPRPAPKPYPTNIPRLNEVKPNQPPPRPTPKPYPKAIHTG